MTSLEVVGGTGDFKKGTLISFSYSEDSTPVDPYDLNGGTGQVSASIVSDEALKGSRVSINNVAKLSDPEYGNISFTIRKVGINQGLASVTGETVQSKLNVDRTAGPQGSDAGGYTLASVIYDYCALCDVVPNFEPGLEAKLDTIDVDFIGWQGNVWEHLKMLCAACPIDADDNTVLEMYVQDDELWFREGLQTSLDTSNLTSGSSVEIDSYDAAQSVTIYKYATDYRADSLIRQEGAENAGFANLENVSITDSMQVSANERITRRVRINASLESVNQPVPVATISTVPYIGTTGEYVIVGKDGLPLQPSQWLSQGGSLSVDITENPNEIEITIVGANYPELEPFRIGVESSGGQEYPALYITGTGVFFEKTEHKILTGAPESSEVTASPIDNPFITDDNKLWTRGVAAAQAICGPSYKLSQQIPSGLQFGQPIGSLIEDYDAKFRVESVSYGQSGVSLTAKRHVTFADFNAAWTGETFDSFGTELGPVSFNEFSIIAMAREN